MKKINNKNEIIQLPEFLKKYFWDCDFLELNINDYSFFISERILNCGDIKAIQWLLKSIDKNYIKVILQKSRNLDNKTRNYWSIILN